MSHICPFFRGAEGTGLLCETDCVEDLATCRNRPSQGPEDVSLIVDHPPCTRLSFDTRRRADEGRRKFGLDKPTARA